MGVTIGKKKLSSGRMSLFLDYNYNGARKKEYLGIVLENLATKDIREKNRELLKLADKRSFSCTTPTRYHKL